MLEFDKHFKTFLLVLVFILFGTYLRVKGLIAGHYYPLHPLALKSTYRLVSATWSSRQQSLLSNERYPQN
jgi:hypothetical protein